MNEIDILVGVNRHCLSSHLFFHPFYHFAVVNKHHIPEGTRHFFSFHKILCKIKKTNKQKNQLLTFFKVKYFSMAVEELAKVFIFKILYATLAIFFLSFSLK